MGKDIVEHFDSIEKFMKALDSRKENNAAMKGENASHGSDKNFHGTKTYEEAVELIKSGWTEKLEEVKKKFSEAVKSNANASMERVRPTTGIVGYAPCVPNAIRGLPNSMISSERTPQKVKAISIVYGTSVDCGWSTREMIDCGITVMKLVNSLELEGYRVRLVNEAMAVGCDEDSATVLVDLKDYRQPLDLKKLCFPVIHPAMLRRICFKWLETVPELENRGFSSGYGTPKASKYDKRKDELFNGLKVLRENEYYLTAYMVKEEKHDIDKIMRRAGMTSLIK